MGPEDQLPFADVDFIGSSLNLARSPPATMRVTLDILFELMNGGDIHFLDVGCGDGRYVIEAARRGAKRACGIDLDPKNIEIARKNALEANVECEFIQGDFFTIDLRDYNILVCYIYETQIRKLAKRLKERLLLGNCYLASVLYRPDSIWNAFRFDEVYRIYFYDQSSVS